MAAFFGPETPRPFSVVSEHFQQDIGIIKDLVAKHEASNGETPFSFGQKYEMALCQSVSRLAEINVDDKVCYVGPKKGSLAKTFESKLKLVKGIHEVQPGDIVYEETCTGRLIRVAVSNPIAEEHFKGIAESGDVDRKYDKVIVRDSLDCLQDRKSFFMNVMRSLLPEGRMLVIQRPAEMITLPYFSEAKRRIHDSDAPVMDTINEIQNLGFDVEWDIEMLPVLTTRLQWLSLLYHRYPTQLEITAQAEIFSGLRELSEGSLKYLWDNLEFNDRLLFVNVSQPLNKEALPECRRFGGSELTTQPAPLTFQMPVTDDLSDLVKESNDRQKQAEGRDEFFGTFNMATWQNVDSAIIPAHLVKRFAY